MRARLLLLFLAAAPLPCTSGRNPRRLAWRQVLAICFTVVAGCATHLASRRMAVFDLMERAVNAADAAQYAALYSPTAQIDIYGVASLQGRPAIEHHEQELLRQFPGTRIAFHAIWESGTVAAVQYAVNTPAPGRIIGHEGLLFYRFDDAGLIVEERRYLDSLTLLGQLGRTAAPARQAPALARHPIVCVASGSRRESNRSDLVERGFRAMTAENPIFERTVVDDLTLENTITFQEWLGRWKLAMPDVRWAIRSTIACEDHVLVEAMTHGTLTGRFGHGVATTGPIAVHQAFVVRAAGDRVASMRVFMNRRDLTTPAAPPE